MINPTNRLKFWFFCKPKHQWAEAVQWVSLGPTFVSFNTPAKKEPTKSKKVFTSTKNSLESLKKVDPWLSLPLCFASQLDRGGDFEYDFLWKLK